MAKEFKRYLVTSALPYANGPVHIGHLAGVYIPSDIYTRYLRRRGRDVLSICGSDEHGVAITIKARKEGVSPKEIIDRYHNLIKRSFERLGMSFDIYSRTSSPVHAQTASDFFRKLYAEGKFIEKTSEQYYDEEAQQFLADRYIVGTCPHCQNEKAYGDQCEKCGSTLSPDELIAPHSALSGSPLVKRETKHWYLPLDKYEGFLREWILEGHKEWRPNVYGQCKSWLDLGLQPRAVSRDLDWGIPVPVEGAGHRAVAAGNGAAVLGETLNSDVKTVSDLIAVTTPPAAVGQEPVADLRQALCNNDRFLLARDLFGGDMDACGRTIDRLNEFDDLDECMIYIAENFDWNPNSDGAKLLVDLIERKLA